MAGQEMTNHRAGPTFNIGDVEIETIEKVVVHVDHVGGGIVGVALKEPVAVIIRSPAGTQRVDLEHLDGRAATATSSPVALSYLA